MDFSLDYCIEKISNPKTKEYFKEVVSSYWNGNYRSSVVMLYSVVICDLIYKMQNLRDIYNDKSASDILDKISKAQKNNPKDPKWETDLINNIYSRTQLISDIEKTQIEHLKYYRNLSAHPVMENHYELYQPPKEIVLGLIKNMYNAIFSKDILLSKDIISFFLEDISINKYIFLNNKYFVFDDLTQLKKFLDNRYFNHMNNTIKNNLFSSLWKFTFKLDNKDCNKNRILHFIILSILFSENTTALLEHIKLNSNKFNIDIKFMDYLFMFLCMYPQIYKNLNNDVKSQLIACSQNTNVSNYDIYMITHIFISKDLSTHCKDLIDYFSNLNIKPDYITPFYTLSKYAEEANSLEELLNTYIDLFSKSFSFNETNNRYLVFIELYLNKMNATQIKNLITSIMENSQIYGSFYFQGQFSKLNEYAKKYISPNFNLENEITTLINN
ncbi:hypothetical protein INF25_03945 [Megamonas funiformis]|nr:hypothetical protein [Megamonas funiformis]